VAQRDVALPNFRDEPQKKAAFAAFFFDTSQLDQR
jgi:hypothetical protein